MARHITATPGVIRIEFPIRARTKTAAPVLDVIRPNLAECECKPQDLNAKTLAIDYNYCQQQQMD